MKHYTIRKLHRKDTDTIEIQRIITTTMKNYTNKLDKLK